MLKVILTLICLLVPLSVYAAPGVSIYATGTYTDTSVNLSLYANTTDCSLISYGVKVGYSPTDLTVSTAEKNQDVWFFGEEISKQPYMEPEISTAGEVVFIGGKLDINDPTAGATGDGILLGTVSFQRNNSNTPAFSLNYGRDGAYKNFVTTESLILDDQADAVTFDPVIPMAGGLHSADTDRVVFFGCYNNTNGVLEYKDCDGDWDFGGAGDIVGGNGNNIIVYRYDAAGDYVASCSGSSLDITAAIVQTPLPFIDFETTVDPATSTVFLTVPSADINTVIVFWGDRVRTEYSGSFPATIEKTYTRVGADYHIRVQIVNTEGEKFNYTFTYDEDLIVSIP